MASRTSWSRSRPGLKAARPPTARDRERGAKTLFGGDIHLAFQERLEHESGVIQQAAALFELHEKIEVAIGSRLSACNRADHSDVARTVASGDSQDVLFPLVQALADAHGQQYTASERGEYAVSFRGIRFGPGHPAQGRCPWNAAASHPSSAG
jgi:hypothetical protein